MVDDREKFQEILFRVRELFFLHGVKSVSMDVIAKYLKVSKKTLYRYVANKNELVVACMKDVMDEDQRKIAEVISSVKGNAVDQMLVLNNHTVQMLGRIEPVVLYDIKMYYPKLFALINEHCSGFIEKIISQNIREGMEQGLYRDELDVVVASGAYISQVKMILDPNFLYKAKKSFSEILNQLVQYHIRGICSEKGLNYLKNEQVSHEN